MENKFDSKEFVNSISEELVVNFDRSAKATTPGLKGAARENEIRKKLENLLPSGVGVGSGCVIDLQGNASRQLDIIIFEKHLCPVFSINDTPETTYYPCEGVIAVGEIKTTIGKNEIEDSFSKIESVKKLKRLPIVSKSALLGYERVSFRKYCSIQSWDCAIDEQFDQNNPSDQIFGFILCGDFSVKVETLNIHISTQVSKIDKSHCPNLIISLHQGIYAPYQQSNNLLCLSLSQANSFLYGSSESGCFEYLLTNLYRIIRIGRTVEFKAFEQYLLKESEKMQLSIISIVPL